jgi:hypothetical protein
MCTVRSNYAQRQVLFFARVRDPAGPGLPAVASAEAGDRALPIAAIKPRSMAEPAAVIDVCRKREQGKILAIEVVLEIEHFWKSGTGDLLFIP